MTENSLEEITYDKVKASIECEGCTDYIANYYKTVQHDGHDTKVALCIKCINAGVLPPHIQSQN